jgi:uracil phosphoribosyltransferase
VVVVSVVAAPEGIERLQREHPQARLVVTAVDDGLDEHGFIVPGLGDFGDRLLGT